MSVQNSIFTCDTDCVLVKRTCIKLDYEDENISYIEDEINSMMKKSVDGIDLCIEDVKTILDKSSKMTYMTHSVFCHKNSSKKEMLDAINLIVRDVILISSKKRLVNYLVHIEMHEGFDFSIVKYFMECIYDLCDDSYVLIGTHERKRKEELYGESEEVKHQVIAKVLMGIC